MTNRKIQANNENLSQYLLEHKNLRVYQNIKNWSGADFIMFVKGLAEVDTFEWEGRNEFEKTLEEQ